MKDMNYRVVQISRSCGTASSPFEPTINTETVYPIGYFRWYSEASLVSELLAAKASEHESVSSTAKSYAVQEVNGRILKEHPVTFKTPDTGGADIEWEPYDGVPADTMPATEELLARDTF